MSSSVRQLLDSFDALSEAEKHEATVELLRRISATAPGELPDEGLAAAADELFLDLDAREAEGGQG